MHRWPSAPCRGCSRRDAQRGWLPGPDATVSASPKAVPSDGRAHPIPSTSLGGGCGKRPLWFRGWGIFPFSSTIPTDLKTPEQRSSLPKTPRAPAPAPREGSKQGLGGHTTAWQPAPPNPPTAQPPFGLRAPQLPHKGLRSLALEGRGLLEGMLY